MQEPNGGTQPGTFGFYTRSHRREAFGTAWSVFITNAAHFAKTLIRQVPGMASCKH